MARVVFVTTSFPAARDDAAGHFVATEAFARARAGDDVTVLAPAHAGVRAHRFAGEGVVSRGPARIVVEWLPGGGAFGFPGALARLRERPLSAAGAAWFVATARRALRHRRAVDVVVAHWLLPSAWPIAGAGSAPIEAVIHGSDLRLFERLPQRARVGIARSLHERGATFRCVSNDLAQRFVTAVGAGLEPSIRVEPAPIEVAAAPDRAAARRRLRIPERSRLCVIVARLVPEKRVDAAIEIARSEAGADRIVVVGGGPLLEVLRRAHPRASFVGQLPRTGALAWIAAADVVVSASRDEGAPTVVREARALGVPVVAVPAGDVRSWAKHDAGIRLVEL